MSRKLSFTQAEFMARLIDATLLQTARQKLNVGDFITAQCFLGNNITADETTVLNEIEAMELDLIELREWISENYGI